MMNWKGVQKMSKFKVGDRVVSDYDSKTRGKVGTVVGSYSVTTAMVEFDEDIDGHTCEGKAKDGYGWNINDDNLELVGKSKRKETPDDMVRYMVYGTGCNNKSDLVRTEKELKEKLNEKVKTSSWSGRIIGYKLVPLYEAQLTTKLKLFKTATKKKL